MLSCSTQAFCRLQDRIPVVGDKALIDLVNGLLVSKDILQYRKNRGFFGRIFDKLDGSNEKRRLILDGNLIAGQEALHDWVLELCNSLQISQVALTETQRSLLEARNAIRIQAQRFNSHEALLQSLGVQLEDLARNFGDRIDKLESRIHQLETRVAASEDIDRIFVAWEAEQTYQNLP
uniref:Uncharacterized protein n=1 Tax=Cyanothece sp. (strain PCC 7425 / ATCC 29141) TaxID=395961 RepID=B8HLV1_CYAP4